MKREFIMKRFILILAFLTSISSMSFAQYNQWVTAGNLMYPRENHTSTLLPDGKVLILAGSNALQHAELYDPDSDSFSETGNTIKMHYQGSTATLLNNGKVLLVGGVNAQQFAELYDPATGNFELIDSLNEVHCYHTATMLLDGRVLIAGGQDNVGPQTHSICEIYDPLTNKFTLTADSLNDHRSSHRAVLLHDGKVLIMGGIQTTTPGSGIYLNSAEIYDPISDTFTFTQSLDQPRVGHQATLLKNGKVLVSGGSYYQKYGEIYDPIIGKWSSTGDMTVQKRQHHTASILHNGKVLLTGGIAGSPMTNAELYDDLTNSFTLVDSMKNPRSGHCAVKLNDGSVLVNGGYDGTTTLISAERYLVDTNDVVSVREVNFSNQTFPNDFQLFQNYPNPFNPSTSIQYAVASVQIVTLNVYDALGNEVVSLVDEEKEAGIYEVEFDARMLTSGIYFCKLKAGSFVDIKKMVLLR